MNCLFFNIKSFQKEGKQYNFLLEDIGFTKNDHITTEKQQSSSLQMAAIEQLKEEALIKLLGKQEEAVIRGAVIKRLIEIVDNKSSNTLNMLISSVYTSQDEYIQRSITWILGEIGPVKIVSVQALIYQLKTSNHDLNRLAAYISLNKILTKVKVSNSEILELVVSSLQGSLSEQVQINDLDLYTYCHRLLGYCAQKISYSDFYSAWHRHSSTISPEASKNISEQFSPTLQTLESKILDLAAQLQRTNNTYFLLIDAQTLEAETETSAIAQEMCNKIYLSAFPNNCKIPAVNNAPQLKRLIPQIKERLLVSHLVLILYRHEPYPELVTFCRKLADMLHVAWITDQPLEYPLRGFPLNQPNLLSALQTWLNELG